MEMLMMDAIGRPNTRLRSVLIYLLGMAMDLGFLSSGSHVEVAAQHDGKRKRLGRDRHGESQFKRVFPYDEIRTMKWNGSPYVVRGGGSANGVLSPTPYLIAYWTLRYYGMLEVP